MSPLVFSVESATEIVDALISQLPGERGELESRSFPDGETYLRVKSDCLGRDVVIVCTLHEPNERILPLLFLVDLLREMGARQVGLVAPYLAYMRQDTRFHEGEGVTSRYFARLLSGYVDWLVTVDPHLHRYTRLEEIYGIPCKVQSAAPLLARWIADHVPSAVLIGPDAESLQWVAAVAHEADLPYLVLNKVRHGDREVEVSLPEPGRWRHHHPVLVDDIISSGATLLKTIEHLQSLGMPAPYGVAVHGVFAEGAYESLCQAGMARLVTSNSIPHPSNAVDIGGLIAGAVAQLLNGR